MTLFQFSLPRNTSVSKANRSCKLLFAILLLSVPAHSSAVHAAGNSSTTTGTGTPDADQSGYRMPPPEVAAIVDATPTPVVTLSPDRSLLLLSERPGLPGIIDLAQSELRLAGIRINPVTNGPSQPRFFTGLTVMDIGTGAQTHVTGLPDQPRITSVTWSPDGSHVAFLHTSSDGIELWIAEISRVDATPSETRPRGQTDGSGTQPHPTEITASRVGDFYVNAAYHGDAFRWHPDSRALLVRKVPGDRGEPPARPLAPAGPVIQENLGRSAPARTYQDLLQDSHDEQLFEYYITSVPALAAIDGNVRRLGEPGLYRDLFPSPDGNWILVSRTLRPFSYTLPAFRFPLRTEVLDAEGNLVHLVADIPLQDEIPIGFGAAPTGPRSIAWRHDAPATLVWAEAQDGGDPRRDADVRDIVFLLDAPFSGDPAPLAELSLRFREVHWANDGLALVSERWWATRQDRIWWTAPGNPGAGQDLLFDFHFEDRYNHPGDPLLTAGETGYPVLLTAGDGEAIYLRGDGATPEGDRPFLDRFELQTAETERLWQSRSPWFERVVDLLDDGAARIITRREAPQDPPNFFVRDLSGNALHLDPEDQDATDGRNGSDSQNGTGRIHPEETHDTALIQLTHFEHPNPDLRDVSRQMITFEREDGVPLSGELYLPPGYDPERDGRLPLVVWAYPREFRSADAAGQLSGSPYSFTNISYWRPQWLVTQGYAVLDNATMPVIGEGDAEPNDTFIEQLVMNAQAAVDAVADLGIADPDRAAIGGHSYGAFMTANILAHSDIFRAGIARSGAYNRSLTPFGFQREERTIWDDTDLYIRMSPFFSADRIRTPILLIHGSEDNNSGTFPMQSERLFAALQGLGGTARLVMLPHEGHGYRARESVMHMLWETLEWLDTYVKPES
jgi:dipeptidyl aminopeptidase/acylaminoacyl peptidase